MKSKTGLLFLALCFVLSIFFSSAAVAASKPKAAKIFEPMINDVVNSQKSGKVLDIGPVAYYKGCIAFFKVAEEPFYSDSDPIEYYLVVYFSPGKWQVKDVLSVYNDLTKLYPEAKYELIAAGYFPH